MSAISHLRGITWHGRKGAIKNGFRYGIDYVLFDAEAVILRSALFARNAFALFSVQDHDHGGAPGEGRGAAWVRDIFAQQDLAQPKRIRLLTQPRVLGHVFNPVSFWLCENQRDQVTAVIAEVTNTFGDRHSYLCHHPDQRQIEKTDRLKAKKIFHVSPFQAIDGTYEFRFDLGPERIGIWIDHRNGDDGVYATLTGELAPLSTTRAFKALLRRPFGARRVLALIHWQALKLWWKGALYRRRPTPPDYDLSAPN